MKKIILLVSMSACLILTGCKDDRVEKILDAVRAKHKDPYSTIIEDVSYGDVYDLFTVCGTVNSKNSFGAYSGVKMFEGYTYGSGPPIINIKDSVSETCRDEEGLLKKYDP